MNKFIIFVALALFVTVSADTCDLSSKDHFRNLDFVDMKSECVRLTEEQIEKEITASLKYLSYGAYFSRDTVNRPGFASFFFNAANEEREHAEKLIDYLSMRGRYFEDQESPISKIEIGKLIKNSEHAKALGIDNVWTASLKPQNNGVSAGFEALRTALKMEMAVTQSIKNLIIACESEKASNGETFNDYHFVDYLTGDFLTEQYQGKRDIAGKISTLGKMIKSNGAELADLLFDKKLQ